LIGAGNSTEVLLIVQLVLLTQGVIGLRSVENARDELTTVATDLDVRTAEHERNEGSGNAAHTDAGCETLVHA
jgi:hypothetical protein